MKKRTAIRHGTQSLLGANLRLALSCVLMNAALNVAAAEPSILFQPKDQTVILYQQAAFGVIASSDIPGLAFQWRKDGSPIAGATNDQIVVAQPGFSDAGRYSVVVSNAADSVISAGAWLTVNPPQAGDLDCSFVCGSSINGAIRSSAVQRDEKVLIAGEFTTVHGAVRAPM